MPVPVPHDDAIAKVTIDGLAICCFNRRETTWDLGFLHPQPPDSCVHELVLQIEGQPEQNLNLASRIRFKTEKGAYPADFPDGFFDNGPPDRHRPPNNHDERENFRWTIDLEDPLDVDHGFESLKVPECRVTRVFIENAVFYTTAWSPTLLFLLPEGQNPNPPNPPRPRFGFTNDEIAADIFTPGNELVIMIDDDELEPLRHRPGNPWKICLTHLCPRLPAPTRPFEKGDFHLFYKAIEISKERHVMWGEPRDNVVHCKPVNEHGSVRGYRSGRTDCDTVRLGTIESLDTDQLSGA